MQLQSKQTDRWSHLARYLASIFCSRDLRAVGPFWRNNGFGLHLQYKKYVLDWMTPAQCRNTIKHERRIWYSETFLGCKCKQNIFSNCFATSLTANFTTLKISWGCGWQIFLARAKSRLLSTLVSLDVRSACTQKVRNQVQQPYMHAYKLHTLLLILYEPF